MAYVVCEPCRDCKYTDCVTVCPTDCFYEDGRMLYIEPESCIDCEACVPECPVGAIYHDTRMPAEWIEYVELNATRVRELKASPDTNIIERKEPLLAEGCRRRAD